MVGCGMEMFTEDVQIFKVISNEEDRAKLAEYPGNLQVWADTTELDG